MIATETGIFSNVRDRQTLQVVKGGNQSPRQPDRALLHQSSAPGSPEPTKESKTISVHDRATFPENPSPTRRPSDESDEQSRNAPFSEQSSLHKLSEQRRESKSMKLSSRNCSTPFTDHTQEQPASLESTKPSDLSPFGITGSSASAQSEPL
jgi:hypothetical protein